MRVDMVAEYTPEVWAFRFDLLTASLSPESWAHWMVTRCGGVGPAVASHRATRPKDRENRLFWRKVLTELQRMQN